MNGASDWGVEAVGSSGGIDRQAGPGCGLFA
jgi:hypothetical protein